MGDRGGAIAEPAMTLTIDGVRSFKGGLLLRCEGVADRSAAENFRDRTLLILADEAEPLEADEYFLHDLVGLEVRDDDGERLGVVKEIYPVGNGYLLGVEIDGREVVVPFNRHVVRGVDVDEGTIVIEVVPGLFEL